MYTISDIQVKILRNLLKAVNNNDKVASAVNSIFDGPSVAMMEKFLRQFVHEVEHDELDAMLYHYLSLAVRGVSSAEIEVAMAYHFPDDWAAVEGEIESEYQGLLDIAGGYLETIAERIATQCDVDKEEALEALKGFFLTGSLEDLPVLVEMIVGEQDVTDNQVDVTRNEEKIMQQNEPQATTASTPQQVGPGEAQTAKQVADIELNEAEEIQKRGAELLRESARLKAEAEDLRQKALEKEIEEDPFGCAWNAIHKLSEANAQWIAG